MIFIDNKYTRAYYAIVNRAKTRITTQKTEQHHVVPESFYVNRSRRGRKGWLEGNPDTPENLVDLTLHEHFVCHLLLTKMVLGTEAQHKVDTAAAWVADCYKSKHKDVRITGRVYAKLRLASAQAQSVRKMGQVAPIKGMTAWNDGSIVKMSMECPGPEFVKGNLQRGKSNSSAKGTKWWNDGTTAVMSKTCPGPGWVLGNMKTYEQLATTLGRKKWNNGVIERTSDECPGPGFEPGRLLKGKYPGNKTGLKAWTNGTTVKFAAESPGPDFRPGRVKQ
jgi:hypothetical protein